MTDIEIAKQDPASVYKKPEDILHDNSLSREQKIDILKRWAYDVRELSVAEEENMIGLGHDPIFLEEILKALLKLGVSSDQDNPPPTKQG